MEPRGGARSLCGCRSPFQKAPLSVCITGAAGQTAYNLVYHIASGYVFGDDQVRGCAATLFYFLFLFGAAGRAAEPCAVVVASFLRAVSAADTRRIVMMVPSQPTRRNPLSLSLSSPPQSRCNCGCWTCRPSRQRWTAFAWSWRTAPFRCVPAPKCTVRWRRSRPAHYRRTLRLAHAPPAPFREPHSQPGRGFCRR